MCHMPIYEYRCDACGHELDELQKLSDAPLTDCPKCGKPALTRLVSAAGFQLKGTGWYATDFKTKKKDAGTKDDAAVPAAAASTDAPAAPKPDAAPASDTKKAEPKAESKPAPKSDAPAG
jgi:putative FmdB family regulatory protein